MNTKRFANFPVINSNLKKQTARWALAGFTCVLVCLANSCTSAPIVKNTKVEGKWFVELQLSDLGKVRTVMTFETDDTTFEAYTRKNADKDILSGWTSLLGRTFTKNFKNGSLMRVEDGLLEASKDTLKLSGILTSAIGKHNVNGYIVNNKLYADIGNKDKGYIGHLNGTRENVKLPLENYLRLFNQSQQVTEQNIYNRDVLNTKEWKSFAEQMKKIAPALQDDIEMVFAFFYYAGKLPVSHYSLLPQPKPNFNEEGGDYERMFFLEEKSPETAYLKIKSFGGGTPEVDSIFNIIRQKGYKNLVVDLRDNSGGSNEAGIAFAAHLTDKVLYGGVLLTQKYFNTHKALPTINDYANFPHFSAANFNLLMEGIHKTDGLCLKVIPDSNVYKGKLYLLTNKRTASTCEPIVYVLKQNNIATVVGERTAGAMLNAEFFELDKRFTLMLPTADYYTPDGYRIDQNGVTPNIETKQEEALDYVMTNLIK
jgi:hypothetical protein